MLQKNSFYKKELSKYKQETKEFSDSGKLNYCFREPDNIIPEQKYPLLIFLHGAGGRGSNNEEQLFDTGSIDAFSKQKIFLEFESFFFAPQVPFDEQWVDVDWTTLNHKMPPISKTLEMTFKVLDEMISNKRDQIDTNRIYIMGVSMGGYGVWDALQRRPDFFAAGVPICGGGDTSKSSLISNIPLWSWHGEKDDVISVQRSREMDDAIRESGGKPKYTEIKNRDHGVWVDVWDSKELWNWLYIQSFTSKDINYNE